MARGDYEDALQSAIEKQNYDLLVFLSQKIPDIDKCDLGYHTSELLWKFLKNKDRALYDRLAPRYPEEDIENSD